MSRPSLPPAASPIEPARLEAMRFFITTIRFGEAIHAACAGRGHDPELVRNLPAVVVLSLVVNGPLRPARISSITGLTTGGTTKLLERLEDAGLVTRELGSVPGDRRGVQVHLTAAGRAFAADIADGLLEAAPTIDQLVVEMQAFLDELRTMRVVEAG